MQLRLIRNGANDNTNTPNSEDPKPVINISRPFDELVDLAEECLANDPSIFQKAGELIAVEKSSGNVGLQPLKPSVLRYLLSRSASWYKEKKDGAEDTHPLPSVARCILDKTHWDKIRNLRAVVNFPAISKNGSIQTEEGYDPNTEVYFTGSVKCDIPSNASLTDAKSAAKLLLDLVSDFPFAGEAHKSAWLAALLSPCARYTHDGNSPIVIAQANSPRVGKTRLVKIISLIVIGDECPVIIHTKNEEEERKRILPFLRGGRAMVLVDNVVGQYGGAAINALATTRSFEDRVLNSSKIVNAVNDTIWFITGNNISLAADTPERCLHIRLISHSEKPHLREDWKYPDLLGMVRTNRAKYLSAALTILKAYINAGMPKQNIPAWGSFEEWSRIVREAIVWIGMPDPAITRNELEIEADDEKCTATSLVEGWLELQEQLKVEMITAREACFQLRNGAIARKLRDALHELTRTRAIPTAHTVGRHLREVRDRNLNGLILKCRPDPTGHYWYVEKYENN